MADSPNHIAISDSFVDDSLSRQLYVFQPSTYKSAFIKIHSERWERQIEEIIKICEDRLLTNAGTVSLNEIGKQLGVTRYSDDNDSYRTSLLLREASATRSTTRPNIVSLIAEVFDLDENQVHVTTWAGRVDIILIDICIASTSAIEEIKRILPILCRYTIGLKTAGSLVGIGSLQEHNDSLTSDEDVYTLQGSGKLGSLQIYDEVGVEDYDADNEWGYLYQIESQIL